MLAQAVAAVRGEQKVRIGPGNALDFIQEPAQPLIETIHHCRIVLLPRLKFFFVFLNRFSVFIVFV